jgi:general secretion pathway protein K
MMARPGQLQYQRGAAILTAMLTVVLVASLASATLWQQWRSVEVEAAQRGRTQSAWILIGAQDWARLILREDARKGGADHLAEPWAVPLEEARLSTFLAADRTNAQSAEDTEEAFLSGQIVDLQSRLNVTNLVQDGKPHEPSQLAFSRLFELLNLPSAELATLIDTLLRAQVAAPGAVAGAPAAPANLGDAPLLPRNTDELAWAGLSAPTLAALRPFITLLPVRTPVNLNTASAEVIYACVTAFDQANAQALVRARSSTHLATLAEAAKAGRNETAQFNDSQHSVSSRFFEVRGNLRVGETVVQEQSVVQRDGLNVKTLWRQRGVALVVPPLQ